MNRGAVNMGTLWRDIKEKLYKGDQSTLTMVFSVIGNSDSFVPRPWPKTLFQTALIEAAKSGGESWIFYLENDKGVSRLVRNAYIDYEVLEFGMKTVDINDSDRHIKLISIAEEKGNFDQKMKTESHPSRLKIALSMSEWNDNQGEREETLLEDIEKFVSEQKASFFGLSMDFKMPIPIVIIMCEGDIGTISHISKALQNKLPVVIMKGSGKAADLVLDFLENPDGLIEKASILFGIDFDDTKLKKMKELLQIIQEHRHIIGVFDLDKDNPFMLSKIIGDTIVKCWSRKPSSITVVHPTDVQPATSKPIRLTMKGFSLSHKEEKRYTDFDWKIFDQYQTGTMYQYVLNPTYSTPTSLPLHFYYGFQMVEKYNMMEQYGPVLLFEALKVNRCDYVSILLDRGVKFDKADIFKLYQQRVSSKDHAFEDMLSVNVLWILKEIQNELHMLHVSSERENSEGFRNGKRDFDHQILSDIVENSAKEFCCKILNYKRPNTTENPDGDMFPNILLWALLFNRRELAEILWLRGKDHLYTGLVCSAILKKLSKKASKSKQQLLQNDLEEHSKIFQQRCVDLMDGMSIENMELSINLMDTEADIWGIRSSPLPIAHEHKMTEVVAHPISVQSMTKQWNNNLQFSLISIAKALVKQRKVFLNAPRTKYFIHQVLSFILLVMYSVFVLTGIGLKNNVWNNLVEVYVYSCCAGNVAEIMFGFTNKRDTSYKKPKSITIKHFFGDFWNVLDICSYLVYISAFLVRDFLLDETLTVSRRMFTFSLLLMYLKYFEVFLIHEATGVKIIMIKKMLIDLSIFLVIAGLLMVGVGVYYHANLWPDQIMWSGGWANWTNWRLWSILYYPYWQLFGEINLGVLDGSEQSSCVNNTSVLTDPSMEICPKKDWTVPLITAIYLLLSNLLLVNLVIAMFTYTFEKVQENSGKHWHYQFYTVLSEYKWRIPSPINILIRPFFFICDIQKGCCKNKVMDSEIEKKIAFQRDFQKIIAHRNHNKIKINKNLC